METNIYNSKRPNFFKNKYTLPLGTKYENERILCLLEITEKEKYKGPVKQNTSIPLSGEITRKIGK